MIRYQPISPRRRRLTRIFQSAGVGVLAVVMGFALYWIGAIIVDIWRMFL